MRYIKPETSAQIAFWVVLGMLALVAYMALKRFLHG